MNVKWEVINEEDEKKTGIGGTGIKEEPLVQGVSQNMDTSLSNQHSVDVGKFSLSVSVQNDLLIIYQSIIIT